MITEDYVSYETAKLLKEKGFNESCYTYYDDIDDTINRFDKGYHFNNTSYPWGVPYGINKAKKYVVAPTLQMTMKWLREVHKILILVEYDYPGFSSDIYKMDDIDEYGGARHIPPTFANCKNYEQACEAAIRYCLENLI